MGAVIVTVAFWDAVICEWFPRFERFRIEGRRTLWFETVEEMQTVLDDYLDGYNQKRPHQGRGRNGRTPGQAFVDGLKPSPDQVLANPPKPVSRSKQ